MATRSVDFTSDIIKGESIVFSFAADSKVDIVDVDGIKISYTYPYSVIDTSTGNQVHIRQLSMIKHLLYVPFR
jgi:hypothetical protein